MFIGHPYFRGMDDLVLLRTRFPFDDTLRRLYFMFVVHIPPLSLLKTILDVIGLGQSLCTKNTIVDHHQLPLCP